MTVQFVKCLKQSYLSKNMLQEEKSANVVQHLSNFTKLNENVGLQWEIPVGENYIRYRSPRSQLGERKEAYVIWPREVFLAGRA